MIFNRTTCPNCQISYDRNSKYCPQCGTPNALARVVCGNCRQEVPFTKFCQQCGHTLHSSLPPQVKENRWVRRPGELAARFDTKDLKGFLSTPLVVEIGTKAIIMADGRNAGVLGPGQYTLDTIGEKIARTIKWDAVHEMSAVVIDDSAVDLTFQLENLWTPDPFKVGVTLALQVVIDDPLLFYEQIVHGQMRYTTDDLQKFLHTQIHNCLNAWVGQLKLTDLTQTIDVRNQLQTQVETYLKNVTWRMGVKIQALRSYDYVVAKLDQVRQMEEENLWARTERDTKLSGRKTIFEIYTQEQLQDIAEETFKVREFEQRAELRQKMRQAVLSDEFNELRTEQERTTFLRQLDQDKLLAEDEWQRLQRTVRWRTDDELRGRQQELENQAWARAIVVDDRERDRAQLLARIDLENRYDLAILELTQRVDLEPQQLAHEREMALTRLDMEQALEAKRQEGELLLRQQRRQAERSEQALDDIARREREISDNQTQLTLALTRAQTQAEINNIQREQDRLDGEMGILLMEKLKAVKLKDEQARQTMALEAEQKRLEMQLQLEHTKHEMLMAQRQQEQTFELNWMAQLKGMAPAELIVAARDTERAQLIRDLQETEALKGMTEGQILAYMSDNNPAAAQALAEIAKAGESGRMDEAQKGLYERLLGQSQQFLQFQREDALRHEIRQQEMFNKALDSQRDTATNIAQATSQPPQQPPVIVTSGMGGVVTTSGVNPAGQPFRCPKCAEIVPSNANFCPNCQHQLRGQ